MSKWLRVDDDTMDFLVKTAESMGMVFESPNAVIRELLGMEPKKRFSQTAKKIRIDDDVWERLKAEADRLKLNVLPLHTLLTAIRKRAGYEPRDEGAASRPAKKPLTR